MFNFTTTNVINSNKDLSTGLPLWTEQDATEDRGASLHVKRVNNFKADNVLAIYKAEAHDGENAKVNVDLSTLDGEKGDQFRILLYIGLTQSSKNSRYANDLYYPGKQFSIDFVYGDDAASTVEKLVKNIVKYEAMVYGDKLLKVTQEGTSVVIEAVDEFQRFKTVNVEKFDPEANHGMGEYNTVITLDDLTEVDSNDAVTTDNYFKGLEGFGTYSYILRNLRLPTTMRTRAFGVNQDETPIVGEKYNQYTIHYCVDRGNLGMNAVGHAVKSVTTHVFFVRQGAELADAFEDALTKIAPDNKIEVVPSED